ncbi:hypothetical protein GCM10009103_46400 [Pseudomonas koreensis]|nr:hypothetical protein GCM10009103_46400 [Pseudomonas koreensis]
MSRQRRFYLADQPFDNRAGFTAKKLADDQADGVMLAGVDQRAEWRALFKIESVDGAFFFNLFRKPDQARLGLSGRNAETIKLQYLRQGQQAVGAKMSADAQDRSLKGLNATKQLFSVADFVGGTAAIKEGPANNALFANAVDFRGPPFNGSQVFGQLVVSRRREQRLPAISRVSVLDG